MSYVLGMHNASLCASYVKKIPLQPDGPFFVCIYTCMHVYLHVYMHTQVYTCMHAQTHTLVLQQHHERIMLEFRGEHVLVCILLYSYAYYYSSMHIAAMHIQCLNSGTSAHSTLAAWNYAQMHIATMHIVLEVMDQRGLHTRSVELRSDAYCYHAYSA